MKKRILDWNDEETDFQRKIQARSLSCPTVSVNNIVEDSESSTSGKTNSQQASAWAALFQQTKSMVIESDSLIEQKYLSESTSLSQPKSFQPTILHYFSSKPLVKIEELKFPPIDVNSCKICRLQYFDSISQDKSSLHCSFCSKLFCYSEINGIRDNCGGVCHDCGEYFCRDCSLLDYSHLEEQVICLDCCRS